jgi:TetR/AcrR family transcriptional regulator, regulator of cefoperazone and chloramphenicol sensitivity
MSIDAKTDLSLAPIVVENKSASDDTATRVLNAAGLIFAEKGFKNATIREICSAAGVNLASVNYHFRDKERLYIETVKRAAQLRVEQAPMPQWPAGTSTATKLRSFVHTILTRMLAVEQAPWQVRLMQREVLAPTSACRELVEDYIRPQFELLLRILGEVVPPETPAHMRRKIAFSVIGQCLHYRLTGEIVGMLVPADELRARFTVDELADHIAAFSLAALGLAPPMGQSAAK